MISDKSTTSCLFYLMCCQWKLLEMKVSRHQKALTWGRASTHCWHRNNWTTKPELHFREQQIKMTMSPLCTNSSNTNKWSIQSAVRLKKATVLIRQGMKAQKGWTVGPGWHLIDHGVVYNLQPVETLELGCLWSALQRRETALVFQGYLGSVRLEVGPID